MTREDILQHKNYIFHYKEGLVSNPNLFTRYIGTHCVIISHKKKDGPHGQGVEFLVNPASPEQGCICYSCLAARQPIKYNIPQTSE